ncbi:MAG TPA: hypothetical protein VLQ48_09370, partial [Chloroflexia bacterium]|nr:hypothetical protein [Chloroflexia bacterium]
MALSSTPNVSRPTLSGVMGDEARTLLRLLKWWPLLPVLLLFLGAVFLTYQTPGTYLVDVGSPSDEAYTVNFHTRLDDNGTTYRWSDVYGYVLFPGIGGGRPLAAYMLVDTERTAPLQVFINGVQVYSSTLTPGWHILDALRVDATHPAALQSRDTVIELRSPDYRTEDAPTEPKGVKVDGVSVFQDLDGGVIWPPIAPLLWLCVALVLLYVLVGRMLLVWTGTGRARLYGLLALVALAGAILWALVPYKWDDKYVDSGAVIYGNNRVLITADAGHIAATLFAVLLIALVVEWVLRVRVPAMTTTACRVLAGLVAMAFLLRFGGMALPQSVIVDMPYHMKWLNTLLTGDWQSLYFPGGLSAVPREWGMELLIPKSPLFYFAFAPLSVLPFDLATSVKWLLCLLDASVVLVVFWLARRAGARVGAASFAAALYAVMPLVFRAFAYGILPTIFAQWLAVLLFAAVLGVGSGRARVWVWFGVLLLATLTLLSFPTVALFVSMVVVGYAVLLLLRPRLRPVGVPRYSWWLLGTLAGGWVLAVWTYYGLYISPVMTSVSAL